MYNKFDFLYFHITIIINMKYLVIVESPAKISKISSYLNTIKEHSFVVDASYGHICEFKDGLKSIDINNKPNQHNLRSIDIYSNNFGNISRYHMPIVRAAYNGKEIYMYPSFVCAALSGYCCDYRWFSGKKNPLSIIIDKWLKGYNILLNGKEQLQLITYFLNKYKKIAMNDIPIFHHYKTRWNQLDVDNVLKRIIKNCKVDANSSEYSYTTDRTRKELEQYLLGKIPIDLKNKKNYGRYDTISNTYMW